MKARFLRRIVGPVLGASLGLVATAPVANAQDVELGTSDVAELTFVLNAGNASSSTFGVKNTLDHLWESASFQLAFGGVRTSSTQRSGEATGSTTSFTPVESAGVTAANYFIRSRYDRTISDAAYIFGGAGWDRNTFAGIENRYSFVSGTGRTWFATDTKRFKTDIGATYTLQNDVTPTPGASDGFLGVRGTWDYANQVTETTTFASVLIVDENLNDTEDLRADFTNSLAVSMSDRMALKISYQMLFDNLPSLESFTLLGSGTPVTRDLKSLDSVFTVALVVNF